MSQPALERQLNSAAHLRLADLKARLGAKRGRKGLLDQSTTEASTGRCLARSVDPPLDPFEGQPAPIFPHRILAPSYIEAPLLRSQKPMFLGIGGKFMDREGNRLHSA